MTKQKMTTIVHFEDKLEYNPANKNGHFALCFIEGDEGSRALAKFAAKMAENNRVPATVELRFNIQDVVTSLIGYNELPEGVVEGARPLFAKLRSDLLEAIAMIDAVQYKPTA